VLRHDAKIDLIKRAPLFAKLPKKHLAEIAQIADELDLPPGKELTTEGAPGREFFVLIDGEADVRRKGRKVNTMKAGDFFGEIALITGAPRTATVTATEPVRTLVLTQRDFRTLLRREPEIQAKVLEALAERLPPEPL
jgi:CRP/FNR family transcriptional regulator, cyclic AMP receptor protein